MTRDSEDSPLFERMACFYATITWNFERFQYFNSETSFLKNTNPFQKTGIMFLVESAKIEKWQHDHGKLFCQKPMLRQIEWGVQNGFITKNRIF